MFKCLKVKVKRQTLVQYPMIDLARKEDAV